MGASVQEFDIPIVWSWSIVLSQTPLCCRVERRIILWLNTVDAWRGEQSGADVYGMMINLACEKEGGGECKGRVMMYLLGWREEHETSHQPTTDTSPAEIPELSFTVCQAGGA